MILRTWLLRVVPGCHSSEYASARSLQWHSGLKRSGYDVRILGVYKLLDGSLSTGLPMSSADDAYLQDTSMVGSHIGRRQETAGKKEKKKNFWTGNIVVTSSSPPPPPPLLGLDRSSENCKIGKSKWPSPSSPPSPLFCRDRVR